LAAVTYSALSLQAFCADAEDMRSDIAATAAANAAAANAAAANAAAAAANLNAQGASECQWADAVMQP
jgi:hypothetical protein